MKPERLPQLDYLRGLAAVGICLYHITIWKTHGPLDSNSILARIGIFGVTIFYLLSGYTLAFVYQRSDFMKEGQVKLFFIKRFFRIYPLLWISTLFTFFFIQTNHSFSKILLNLTGLFGLFAWEKYIATGAWSIGNELFFYLFFPIFIWSRSNARGVFFLIGVFLLSGFLYQTFLQLTSTKHLSEQWSIYINPFIQIFAFYLGVALQTFSIRQRQGLGIILLLSLTLVFCFFPVHGNQIYLVTGWARILFMFVCTLFVFLWANLKVKIPNWLHFILNWLGEISYSVYLLHPICFWIWSTTFREINLPVSYFWTTLFIFILAASTFSYYLFEKTCIRLGQYMTKRK